MDLAWTYINTYVRMPRYFPWGMFSPIPWGGAYLISMFIQTELQSQKGRRGFAVALPTSSKHVLTLGTFKLPDVDLFSLIYDWFRDLKNLDKYASFLFPLFLILATLLLIWVLLIFLLSREPITFALHDIVFF